MVDYRKLRLSNITSPEFSHVFLVLFWPVFEIAFASVEVLRPLDACHPVWCPLDDLIPFNEWFLFPYLFWFVFLAGMNVYLFFCDPNAFRRFMYFTILTYTATMVFYMIYPTCQNLRPETFPRNNLLTRFIAHFYAFDTNTNVCPSLHVIGAFAAVFGAWDTPRFQSPLWKTAYFVMALLISISTMFMKQHSALDVISAFGVCAVGYLAVYILPSCLKKRQEARTA